MTGLINSSDFNDANVASRPQLFDHPGDANLAGLMRKKMTHHFEDFWTFVETEISVVCKQRQDLCNNDFHYFRNDTFILSDLCFQWAMPTTQLPAGMGCMKAYRLPAGMGCMKAPERPPAK